MKTLESTELFLDVGNTAIKWHFAGSINIIAVNLFDAFKLPRADNIWVSSVNNCDLLRFLSGRVYFAKVSKAYKNLKCGYKDVTQLGIDRWLAMIASYEMYPQQNLLVIDIGSALTFDIVLANGVHQGGLIMPGLGTLRTSFAQFKTNIDDLCIKKIANNTEDSWVYGTGQMLICTINKMIHTYLDIYKKLIIILTGGYAKEIIPKLDYDVEFVDNLVLAGLHKYSKIIKSAEI